MKEDIGFVYMFKDKSKRYKFYNIVLEKCKEEESTPNGYIWKAESVISGFTPHFVVITCRGDNHNYWDDWLVENINRNNLNIQDSMGLWVKQQTDVVFLSKEIVGIGNK